MRNDNTSSNQQSSQKPEHTSANADGHIRAMGAEASEELLVQTLGDFKRCVHAWSDAEYHRPRMATVDAKPRGWRVGIVWALGCLVSVSVAGGGMYQHEHRKQVERIAAEREAQKRQAEERARETEELLAHVDSDVSQQVPDAMEPLARLMAEDDSQ